MGLIRLCFNLCGPYAWVLDGKGAGNNYNFLETVMFPGFNNHPGNAGIKRKLGHNSALAERRNSFPVVFKSTKLMKQFVAIPDCSGCWRIDEREGGPGSPSLRSIIRRITSARFERLISGRVNSGPTEEVILAVKSDAGTWADTAASALALITACP